jgi:hypothetical protein
VYILIFFHVGVVGLYFVVSIFGDLDVHIMSARDGVPHSCMCT